MTNLYDALDIDKTATTADVRKAYRKAAKMAHPDAGGSVERFALVKLAHDTLSDDARRHRYDETGEAGGKELDQTESAAMQHAFRAVDHVMCEIIRRSLSWSDINVIDDAVLTLEREQGTLNSQITDLEKALSIAQKASERFKPKKGKTNYIGQMMDAKIADMKRGVAAKNLECTPLKRAIEILKDHTYDMSHERRPAEYNMHADLQGLMNEAMKPGPIDRSPFL